MVFFREIDLYMATLRPPAKSYCLENLVYHFFRQLWLVLGVKLMEIKSNLFSRCKLLVGPTFAAVKSRSDR